MVINFQRFKCICFLIGFSLITACGGGSGSTTTNNGGETGGSTGGETGGETGGSTGGETGGSTGGETGGSTGGETGGSTGGETGGSTGGETGGSTGGETGGSTGGETGGSTGGETGGETGGSTNGNYSITANSSSLSFNVKAFESSTSTQDVQITFQGDGLLAGFATNADTVNWLSYETIAVTEDSATIRFNIDHFNAENETGLAPNNYQTTFRFTTGNIVDNTFVSHDIDIDLTIWPNSFNFRQAFNESTLLTRELAINVLDTEWEVTENVDWLSITSNTVNNIQTFTFTADATATTGSGEFSDVITFNKVGMNETQNTAISLLVDDINVYANVSGIGLYKLADAENLSQQIGILFNNINSVDWQASSDADWLTLTQDNIDNTLTIVKNDNILDDGEHYAEIVLSTVDAGISSQRTVHIGYYQTSESSTATTLEKIENNNNVFDIPSFNKIALDPIRPLFYLADNNTLTSYNMFTGEAVDSINTTINFSHLAISPNGQYLLASAKTLGDLIIYQLDLSENSFNSNSLTELPLPDTNAITNLPTFIGHINGYEVIITNTLEITELPSLTREYQEDASQFNIPYIQQAINVNIFYFVQNEIDNSPDNALPVFYRRQFSFDNDAENKVSVITANLAGEKFNAPTENKLSFFDVNNNGNAIYTAQFENEWISISDSGNITFEGTLTNDSDVVIAADLDHSFNDHTYLFRSNASFEYSITEYDENQQQVGDPVVIANASDSSFIQPIYRRVITRPDGGDWFITSF